MSNNCLSVLYKHIIEVENKNVGLKVGGGGGHKHTIAPPPNQKSGGGGTCPPCPPDYTSSDQLFNIRSAAVDKLVSTSNIVNRITLYIHDHIYCSMY